MTEMSVAERPNVISTTVSVDKDAMNSRVVNGNSIVNWFYKWMNG